ncbi:MAG: hypothetical protein ACI8UD_003855 [Planctomycetota bacterium]|jgi:N-acetylneuraminic acid mutarotase
MQAHLSLSILATAACLSAQGDFDFDKVTPGTLGGTLTLAVENAPASMPLLAMVSVTAGPTPIALIDPVDSRSVAVGVELLSNWSIQLTSAIGTATLNVPLPNLPTVQGYVFHWQAATLPGATTLFDQLSNPVTTHHVQVQTSAALPSTLLTARVAATICDIPSRPGGGDFLLISGGSSEFFNFRTLDSEAGPAPSAPAALYAAATLNDGRVIFTGGLDGTGVTTTACEIYDPANNTFSVVAAMPGPLAGHSAATLADGRVMIVGGTNNFTDLTTAIAGVSNASFLYDPVADSWTSGPNIGGRRLVPALSRLSNGLMMISGGIQATVFFGIPIAVTSTTAAQLYNPLTNSWSNAASMPSGRAYHQDNQVTLADGRLMLTGGVLIPSLINVANAASIAGADIYDPVANSWQATTMLRARTGHSATLLPSGDVVVCGGSEGLLSAAVGLDAVSIFDPVNSTWTAIAPMVEVRIGHTGKVLPDGSLVLLGPGTSGEAMHF